MGSIVTPVVVDSQKLPGISDGTSTADSEYVEKLKSLYSLYGDDDLVRTILRVASRPPPKDKHFPHHTIPSTKSYNYEPSEWWTSGFFPGSIWLLCQRSLLEPLPFSTKELMQVARQWQTGLEQEQFNTETHDLGFMIMPTFYRDFLMTGNTQSRDIVIQAARSLSMRWNEKLQCFRSWDRCTNKRFSYEDMEKDFLVIIDNMMNLDLLYVASSLTGDPEFARRATAHAWTTLRNHLRPDHSTYHLVNYDAMSGAVKGQHTVQGYEDASTWSRGQAWALYGFATAYRFTGETAFLDASRRLARYFCLRVNETSSSGVVYWDFDAPPEVPEVWDTSAAMIASSGMLLLYHMEGEEEFLPTVVQVLTACALIARNPPSADTILDRATVNNNQDAVSPVKNTGLVYADYYFLEVGNRLLEIVKGVKWDVGPQKTAL
jgi:hypothetical protein